MKDVLATAVSEWTCRPKVATQFLRTLARCDHPELGKLVRTILMVMQESQVQVPWVKDIECFNGDVLDFGDVYALLFL